MQDATNKTERTQKRRRQSYDSLKISRALAEECSSAGIALETFLLLRPSERMKRLSDRMRALGMLDCEIPKERGYRTFWERLKRQIDTPQEA